ncbi:MAG: hypothetical protein ONB14_01290 [candidate division KSB1 bacterium]|nr:hypothetical protein [candidate division KSB1 bacterium]MDZ7378770.1 hypothetical protein [candidate division KSB1 bacterium]MDZ7392501.1 hypothetical protein [candidate division KSB1 bacterium]MDZ7413691.1 hypothetical protein [candidate division KSB1 bacterium]
MITPISHRRPRAVVRAGERDWARIACSYSVLPIAGGSTIRLHKALPGVACSGDALGVLPHKESIRASYGQEEPVPTQERDSAGIPPRLFRTPLFLN